MYVGKKVILLLAFLPFLLSLHAQNYWTVSSIDSFQTTNVGQGVHGLNSIVHDDAIHLTYFYHDQNSQTTLLYAVKTNDNFVVDTVAHISGFNSYRVSTSIQFNSDGSKWIYAGFYSLPDRIIGVFKQNGADWDYTFIDATGNSKTVAAIQNNSEMGFVYFGRGKNNSLDKQSVKYAYWNGSSWEIETISERNDTYKTNKPSIVEAGGKIYLTYGEGMFPDSLITRVFVKENQVWSQSFFDLFEIPYAGGAVDGLYNLVGITSDGKPALLHTLSKEVHPRFFKMNNGGWTQETINYPTSWGLTFGLYGSNILFDAENTMFVISQANYTNPRVSWVKENGDAGYSEIPFRYGLILQDFVILNNKIFVYYYDGYLEYPYNRPTTLKEAKIDISDLLTGVEESSTQLPQELILYQNYPNPFNPVTTIKFSVPHTSYLNLKIFDLLGREVRNLLNDEVGPGIHTIQWDGTDKNGQNIASGIYIYKLTGDGYTLSRKLLLLK